jgi:DNA-binding CsgD family transcriptional regulator
MNEHLGRAVEQATEHGRPAARCEALVWLALEAARLGASAGDETLLATAERSARDVQELVATLPGHPPWGGFAAAATVEILLARGDEAGARAIARPLVEWILQTGERGLEAEPILPLSRALVRSADPEEQSLGRMIAGVVVGLVAERTEDADVLARWLAVTDHQELTAIAGGLDAARNTIRAMPDTLIPERLPVLPLDLTADESALMRLMMEGRSDFEIARELSIDEAEVTRQLGAVFAKIGAPSRSVATLYAFMADIV